MFPLFFVFACDCSSGCVSYVSLCDACVGVLGAGPSAGDGSSAGVGPSAGMWFLWCWCFLCSLLVRLVIQYLYSRIRCVLCFVFCVLCFVFCVLCVLCFVFCVLCFVFCVLLVCCLCVACVLLCIAVCRWYVIFLGVGSYCVLCSLSLHSVWL